MQKIASTITADPIIAAIATHKRLERKWLDLCHARDAATEAGLSGPSEKDVELAADAAIDAGWSMAETRPRTIAGATVMLRYIAKDGLFDDFGKPVWCETAFESLQRGLAKLARESRQAEAA